MTRDKNSVLLIDDDDALLKVMEFTLRKAGLKVIACCSGKAGLREFSRSRPGIVITDMQLGEMSGVEIIEKVKKSQPQVPIIVITGHGSIDNAVEAMKLGACEYLVKPFSCDQLRFLVDKVARQAAFGPASTPSQARQAVKEGLLIGSSERMQAIKSLLPRVAAKETTILLLGESGTGKELVARTLHHGSGRAAGPFVAVNCAAIPRDLLESELFGHRKGAFTGAVKDRIGKFQQAAGGTLFLDEIGELPSELQPKLLRVLQERMVEPLGGDIQAVDVRVIAATNVDLEDAVRTGAFREDLYYRLAVLPITVPPLRQRREDIPLLFAHFLDKYADGSEMTVTREAMECLQRYDWPGNVRELENIVERTLILCPYPVIEIDHLPPHIRLNSEVRFGGVVSLPRNGYPLEELEKEAITQALLLNDWNQSRAAQFLRIPRHVLAYRVEKYAIRQS